MGHLAGTSRLDQRSGRRDRKADAVTPVHAVEVPLAAAFDTRMAGAPMLTGRASRAIGRLLRRHGYRLAVPPESFVVTKVSTLADGESSRARPGP
jgi:hypothetical protein